MVRLFHSGLLVMVVSIPLLVATCPAAAVSLERPLERQRALFQEARAALDTGKMERFASLKSKLKGYPLTPYLELWQAARHIDQGYDLKVLKTLATHRAIPEAVDLQIRYVKNLAERGQWPHVAIALKKLPDADRLLPEIAMRALWYTDQKSEALERFSRRWQRGFASDDSIYRIEQKWFSLGHPTRKELWHRIGSLVRKGQWDEVRNLEKKLGKNDRKWLARWHGLQQNPQVVLSNWNTRQHHIAAVAMVGDGLQRLSRRDAAAAWPLLQRLKPMFDQALSHKFQRRIALRAATEQVQASADWLAALPASLQDKKTRGWVIRIHLLHGQWVEALNAIRALPENERRSSRWQYWQARALASLGKHDQAKKIYMETAQGRGYYSFLSAERAGLPYRMGASNLDASGSAVASLKREKGIRRAHEWWLLGDDERASREWSYALAGASSDRWRAAAVLASKWQQHNHVIQAAYLAGEVDALDKRFPVAYAEEVVTNARSSGLSTSLIWSIIRQESAFNTYAVSRTGARGLMQLMPETAEEVAESELEDDAYDLFDPATNIRLGSLYLGSMLEQFDQNFAIAAAAYNAGPHRVSQWLKVRPFDEPDIWIETIPYFETRRYVQQVMAFTVVYDWRQSKAPAGIVAQLKAEELKPLESKRLDEEG